MQDQATTRTRPASRPRVRDGLIGPPRPSWSAQFSLVVFGLLLTASLAIPALTDTTPTPGLSLVFAGLMLTVGVAELLDATVRRLVIALRFGGMAVALLGLTIQWVPGLG